MTKKVLTSSGLKFRLPDYESPSTDINAKPLRKFELDLATAERVVKIIEYFERLDIDTESLYKFFREWQSEKTKSVKKFVMSLSFLLVISSIAGVSITDIDVFGVAIETARETPFLIVLLFIHLSSSIYWWFLSRIDLKVHYSKSIPLEVMMEDCIVYSNELDGIIEENKIPNVPELIADFKHNFDAIEIYYASKFYESKLKKLQKRLFYSDIGELGLVTFLAMYALVTILILLYDSIL